MNQKEWSRSINCPQKTKRVILNQNLFFFLLKSDRSSLLEGFLKKVFLNSLCILRKVTLSELLRSPSVNINFQKNYQELNKNSF